MNIPHISDYKNGWLTIEDVGDFSVFRTFDCGQCFRFDPTVSGGFTHEVSGTARGKTVSFAENSDGKLYIKASPEDFFDIWLSYLGLDIDYGMMNSSILSGLCNDDALHMERAMNASKGIRILRQDPWEALISFIISQNNNIPRIKKIISALCEKYGEAIDGGYAFPTAEVLANAGEDALFELKTGFRAKYIADAARKVASGEIDLQRIRSLDYTNAQTELMKIKGVGPKVCACTLLFGFEKLSAFPIDVWIKKVLANRFSKGFDPSVFGEYAGVAQQYLFYFERYIGEQLQ